MSPEAMIELALAGKGNDLSQELWSAFLKGFPIENLRPLLTSKDQAVLEIAAYLVYELGGKARSLIDDIIPLLGNEDPQIRASAVIALEECATKFDVAALGRIIELLDDPDPFLHRIVMRFIQYCDFGMLEAGLRAAALSNQGTVFEQFPKFFQRYFYHRRGKSDEELKDMLSDLIGNENPIAPRLGVGLATRPRLIADHNLIDLAERAKEEECCNIVMWAREGARAVYADTKRL